MQVTSFEDCNLGSHWTINAPLMTPKCSSPLRSLGIAHCPFSRKLFLCLFVFYAVIEQHDQKQYGEGRVYLTYLSQSQATVKEARAGAQGRIPEAGTAAEPRRSAAHCPFRLVFSGVTYTTQDLQPGAAPPAVPRSPTSISNQESVPQTCPTGQSNGSILLKEASSSQLDLASAKLT